MDSRTVCSALEEEIALASNPSKPKEHAEIRDRLSLVDHAHSYLDSYHYSPHQSRINPSTVLATYWISATLSLARAHSGSVACWMGRTLFQK